MADKAAQLARQVAFFKGNRLTLNKLHPWTPKKQTARKYKRGKGHAQNVGLPSVGYEKGSSFYVRYPIEPSYYNDRDLAGSQARPLSLLSLQRGFELGLLDGRQRIDISYLVASGLFVFNCGKMGSQDAGEFGFDLVADEMAMDCFASEGIMFEVQRAEQNAIACVERLGGVVVTRYYDKLALQCLKSPRNWFLSGKAIPSAKMPPRYLLDYYTDPLNRGYLADDDAVVEEQRILAQKFAYQWPPEAVIQQCGGNEEKAVDRMKAMRRQVLEKRWNQLFFGLEPGSVVSLVDELVFEPVSDGKNENEKTTEADDDSETNYDL